MWTWTAICADTKLVPPWLVGERTVEDGSAFMQDLASRPDKRIQLSTDRLFARRIAVESAFFGQLDCSELTKN